MAPIKRHEALVSFSRDHHNGLLLVWKVRQGLNKDIDPTRIGKYVLFAFDVELAPHFRDGEEWLFASLPDENPGRNRAEKDHAALRETISSIRGTGATRELLEDFANGLENHIRFEERELFNEIQQLPDEILLPIAERFKDHYCAKDDGWEDKFW